MSSGPRQTMPSTSLLVSPASSSACFMASSSRPSALTPLTRPSLLLPVPTMAYLSRSSLIGVFLFWAFLFAVRGGVSEQFRIVLAECGRGAVDRGRRLREAHAVAHEIDVAAA